MATWQEVKNYIHANLKADDIDDSTIQLVWDLGNNRSQLVSVTSQLNGEAVVVFSPIGHIDKIDLKKLLMMTNDTLFSVACIGDIVGMQQLLNTATLDEAELAIALNPMAEVADVFERELTGGDQF